MGTVADRRPRLPSSPLAPLALAVALGIAADRYLVACSTPLWSALALALTILAALLNRRRPTVSALALLCSFLALGGAWHHDQWFDLAPGELARSNWEPARPAWVRGVVTEVPEYRPGDRAGDEGVTTSVLSISAISDGQGWHPASGRVALAISGLKEGLEAGDPVQAAGNLSALAGPLNPGESDRRDYWRAQGVRLRLSIGELESIWPDLEQPGSWFLRWLGRTRSWSHRKLVEGLEGKVAPLGAALLLGRRDAVDPEVNDAFARTGTTHLLAISGSHLQVLSLFFWFCCRALGFGRKPAFLAVATATVAYSLLVGLMPSVVRSAVMTSMVCLGGFVDRNTRPGNLLAMAALATLAWNPANLFDAGCQLSFLAVAAILWGVSPALALGGAAWMRVRSKEASALDALERRFEPWWRSALRRTGETFFEGLMISAVVWVVCLPLVMLRFHVNSPVGILINIPLVPLTSAALMLAGLTLALSAVWAPLGQPTAWACALFLRWTESIVRWGAAQAWGHSFTAGPHWVWALAFYCILGLASLAAAARWRGWRWAWGGLGAWVAAGWAIALIPHRPETLEADVLAVGHGLSIVVQAEDGRTVLYDCGRMADPHIGRRVIAPALWSRGVRRLETVFLSHADADHFNALPDLLDRFAVSEVRVPPGFGGPSNPSAERLLAELRLRKVPIRTTVAGEQFALGQRGRVHVLHPPRGWQLDAPDNDRSLVLDVESNDQHLLLTGDLDGAGLTELVAQPSRPLALMLAPHHGGRSANPGWLYSWASPGQVIVSQRRPAPGSLDALAILEAQSLPVLRTWNKGAIRLRWTAAELAARGFLEDAVAGQYQRSDNRVVVSSITLPLPPWLRVVLGGGGFLLGLIICFILLVIEWGAFALVRPRRKLDASAPEPPPWEPIETMAPDGVRLRGALLLAKESGARTALLLHGFAEERTSLLGRAEALHQRGWNVALLDARGRGLSVGDACSFGGREAADLRAWAEHLTQRIGPGLRLAAWGRSMGAAIALRAALEEPRIQALVLEAPYPDLAPSVAAWLSRLRLPRGFARAILWRAHHLAGVSLDRPCPLELAPRVPVPVLILHGQNDPIVPLADARRLASAFPTPAELIEVPSASHGDVFDLGGAPLSDRIAAFLQALRALPADEPRSDP
jgi:competence protein ComEC